MRHVLMFVMVLGMTLGLASASYAREDGKDGDVKGGDKEEPCDPKKENCPKDPPKDSGKAGSWQDLKPGSRELEDAKIEMQSRRDAASQAVKDYLANKRKDREMIVNSDGKK